MKSTSRAVFAIILASFFLSGVAGLVYQVVWTRYLALFLGHTSYAVVAVLISFMGGLALGNAWLGAKVDALRRPLVFYAWLELGIGLYGLCFPVIYPLLESVYHSLVRSLHPTGAILLTLKFVVSAVAILPPTILMGATLPALTKFVTRSLSELRGKVAALYAINSTGAVLGTVYADWWAIPTLGLEASVQSACAMSLVIGLVAWVVSHRTEVPGAVADGGVEASPSDERYTREELRLGLLGIGVSGFVAMLYEVAWTRLLALAIGGSTHAYALMLITFISGISVGSWIIYRWRRPVNTLEAFAWAELALAATLFASMFYYDRLPYWFVKVAGHLSRQPGTYPYYELVQALICFGVMFVPAICLGMTLPLISRVATSELARTGRSVGIVFAVNTLGTVLGAALTGLFLMPRLGLPMTLSLGIALNAATGLLVLGWRRKPEWSMGKLIDPAIAMAGIVFAGSMLGKDWKRVYGFGAWRLPEAPATWGQFMAAASGFEVVYHRDGAGSTVAVTLHTNSAGGTLSLRVNGKTDASSAGDLSTQLLVSHIPMLLHTRARDVLVVGCGSGISAGGALCYPTVTNVDLVEISPEVIEAADKFFSPYNNQLFRDPRLHVALEDAKSFLKTTDRKYDVIATEPSNPWMAGVAAVFSREYYEDCRERLKPGGIVAQWLQTYETDDATFDMVVATFGRVFPYMSIWQTGHGDVLLVGSVGILSFDLDASAQVFETPAVKNDLRRAEFTSLPLVLALQMVAFGDAAFLPSEDTRLHSDFFPQLEYAAQRAFFVRQHTEKFKKVGEVLTPRARTLLLEWYRTHPFNAEDLASYANAILRPGLLDPVVHRAFLYRCLAVAPTNGLPLKILTEMAGRVPAENAEMARLALRPEFRTEAGMRDVNLLRQFAGLMLLVHRGERSILGVPTNEDADFVNNLAYKLDAEENRVHSLHLAELMWDRGRDQEFLNLVAEGMKADPGGARPNFGRDPDLPFHTLARMFQLAIERRDFNSGLAWLESALSAGYVTPASVAKVPRLGMLARRLKAESADFFHTSTNPVAAPRPVPAFKVP